MRDDQEQDLVIELDPGRSAREDRERLLAETAVHAAGQDAQYRHRTADHAAPLSWRLWVAAALFAAAGWVAVSPPGWLLADPLPTPTAADVTRGLHAQLLLQAQEIEAFRLREGRLPTTLEELPQHGRDILFVRSSNRVYQLVAIDADGSSVVYDSVRPDPAFRAAATWRVEP